MAHGGQTVAAEVAGLRPPELPTVQPLRGVFGERHWIDEPMVDVTGLLGAATVRTS